MSNENIVYHVYLIHISLLFFTAEKKSIISATERQLDEAQELVSFISQRKYA